MKKILSFIAPQGFQDVEYADSKAALEEAGCEVITVSDAPEATGKFGASVKADILLDEVVDPSMYHAFLLVGGPGVYLYLQDARLHALAKRFLASGKVTAAICAAPSVLAQAGLLKGKRATCFAGEAENLKARGAEYTGARVEQDGLIVTADGPESARLFGQKVAKLLAQ